MPHQDHNESPEGSHEGCNGFHHNPSDTKPEEDSQDPQLSRQPQEQEQGTFLTIIRNFSNVWFTVTMDTGVLSVVMHQLPYKSHWINICSTIAFVLTLILFIVFGTLYLLRWMFFFKETRRFVLGDLEEIALQVAPAITFMLLVAQIELTCAQAWGYAFTIIAYVLWWIGLAWIVFICWFLYLQLIRTHNATIVDQGLPTTIFIPIVGCFTVANVGGVILNNVSGATHISEGLAVPVIIVGFMVFGFGLFIALMVYAIYMHRLMTAGWPEAKKLPGLILTIGPMGQSAAAIQQLSSAAVKNNNFGNYNKGTFLTADSAKYLQPTCTMLALLLLGFAVFWMAMAYFAIIQALVTRKLHPSLTWWSSIFPVGTVALAFISLATAMDSSTFRVLTCIVLVFLLSIFFFNAIFTIPMVMSGEILGIKKRKSYFNHDKIDGPGLYSGRQRRRYHT